jgi:predicted P-loop ATPase
VNLTASNLKTQCDSYLKLGKSADQIVTLILSGPGYASMAVEAKELLASQIISYATEAKSVQATLVAEFPIGKVSYTRDGDRKQTVTKDHPENLKYLITSVLNIVPEYNELKNRIHIDGKQLTDRTIGHIRNRCREYGLSDSKEFVIEVLEELAYQHSYNPFLRALEGTVWDGHDHIADLFSTLTLSKFADENRPIVHQYLRRWLIAVCRKVIKPGSQNLTLTFKSKQGDGKSRWIEKLVSIAPEMYGEGAIDISNKDHTFRHLNYIIWHIPEIDGSMRKSDAGLLKDYLTKAKVNEREAYARTERSGDSVLSFVASVNSEEFLVDDTGSRRFLVIELDDINAEHDVNILQVWAQALQLCRAGEKYYFDKEEIKTINEMNGSFQTTNHVNEMVRMIEPGDDWLSGVQMFAYFLGKSNPTNTDMQKLGLLLKKANIDSKRVSINGTKTMLYKIKKPEKPIF